MLTLLTKSNHIKIFKNNKIWNPSPVQRLAIVDPHPPVGFGCGLTLVLHGKLQKIREGEDRQYNENYNNPMS